MRKPKASKAFLLSASLHVFLLIFLIATFEFTAPILVISNNDPNVINAFALQDSPLIAPPSKAVMEIKPSPPLEVPPPAKPTQTAQVPTPPKPAPHEQAAKAPPQTDKLALPDPQKKTVEVKKTKQVVNKDLSKQLMADMEDEIAKQAKAKQKQEKKKFSQELKTQSEKAIEQLMKEQKEISGQQSKHMIGIIDKYKAMILQAISQRWVVPGHVDKHLSCELFIRLAPGGEVLDVHITKSSGDEALDRSALKAVYNASPLPVPEDIYSFKPFREFILKVRPELVVESDGDQGLWIS